MAVAAKWIRPFLNTGHAACASKRFVSGGPKEYYGQPTHQTHPHLVREGEVTPGISLKEYQSRRLKYTQQIPPRSLSVFVGNTSVYMTNDIPYRFRQQSDFFYLTGVMEPDTALIIYKGANDAITSTLFVQPKDKEREIWDGPRNGVDASKTMFGVDESHPMSNFSSAVLKYAKEADVIYADQSLHSQFDPAHFNLSNGKHLLDNRSIVQSMRNVKSAAEQDIMRRACSISARSFNEVLKCVHPGMNESFIDAKLEFEFRQRGGLWHAYPPVVAGGSRANTLHYVRNDEFLEDGTLVLVDSGCELYGYSSDITRTWPVGKSITKGQADVYGAVHTVLKDIKKLCVPGNSHQANHQTSIKLLTQALIDLGLLKGTVQENVENRKFTRFYMHGIGHWLGMDVHDTPIIPTSTKLVPGMIVTVEPGIYIPDEPDIPADLRGIGIRLEDDVLVTASAPETLTHEAIIDLDVLLQHRS